MKKANLFFAMLLGLLWLASGNVQALEVIVSGREQAMARLSQDPGVLKQKRLFSKRELKSFRQMSLGKYRNARVFTLQSVQVMKRLQKQMQIEKLKLSLEPRQLQGRLSNEVDLPALQWALHNTGKAQFIDLDPMIYFKVPGRAGEDIGLQKIPALQSKAKIIVAVLDTGIQKDHPALAEVIKKNDSECRALEKFHACSKQNSQADCENIWMNTQNPEVDQDQNGYPLDCQGWSLLSGTNAAGIMGGPDFADESGHGTHVAGIIAAQKNSQFALAGVSQNVLILPVQVIGGGPSEPIKPMSMAMDKPMSIEMSKEMSIEIDPREEKLVRPKRQSFLADMVARAVIYAVNSGAKVINFSMGWPENQDSPFMQQIIQAAQAKGILIVAAAGNDSTRALLRPCAYSGVICVGASGPDGAIAHYSNYGSGVDLLAPGTNILSTYPQDKRPIRMRQTMGYEFLSGTSQATPIVSGLLAEMMARGFSGQESVARLISSARAVQKPLDLIGGTPHAPEESKGQLLQSALDQSKYILSGNVDIARAVAQEFRPLLVPAKKEKIEIKWNRQSEILKFNFALRNIGKSFAAEKLKYRLTMLKDKPESVRPTISGSQIERLVGEWKTLESKELQVQLKITDQVPEKSNIPSEFSMLVEVEIDGKARQFVVDAEILVMIDPKNLDPTMTVSRIIGMPQERTEFIPIDENLDGSFRQDYALGSYEEKQWKFWLMAANSQGTYEVTAPARIPAISENADSARVSFLRADLHQDGESEYILTIYDDKSASPEPTPSPQHFYFFNHQMQLLESFVYDSKKSQIPYAESVKWTRISGKLRPVWMGPGLDPSKVRNPWDIWEDPEDKNEVPRSRLYFINQANQLQAIQTFQDYDLIDTLEASVEQKRQGRVPVLLAKNRGSVSLPSYIYDFAVAEFFDGQLQKFAKLELFANEQVYRNLLDTRIGKVLSLDLEDEIAKGTFWFSEGKMKEQRLSVLLEDQQQFLNQSLKALRNKVDAALWVRTVFAGRAQSGAFVLTNSELQYHDLKSGEVVAKSMERYSFFPNNMMTNLQFPILVYDRAQKVKLPAIFTTENSGLSRGIKVTVPQYFNGKLIELNSPARLRLRTEAGCKPMDTPIWGGKKFAAALDYFCNDQTGQKMLRVQLDLN